MCLLVGELAVLESGQRPQDDLRVMTAPHPGEGGTRVRALDRAVQRGRQIHPPGVADPARDGPRNRPHPVDTPGCAAMRGIM